MINTSSKQTGSAHVIIIGSIVAILIIALGIVFWQNFIQKDVPAKDANENININTSKNEEKPKDDRLTYRNELIGIEFKYPKDWIKVECGPSDPNAEYTRNQVYFGTTNEGIGIVNGESILCGGGTDFPPQMVFTLADSNEEYKKYGFEPPFENIKIDGKNARKSTRVAGQDTIMSGLETTSYSIDISETQHIGLMYNRYPKADKRDNSEASRQLFIDVVEKSLRFL